MCVTGSCSNTNRADVVLPGNRTGWVVATTMALLLWPGAGAMAQSGDDAQGLEVDTARSYIVARTGRAGVLGFLGHEHGVLATEWTAEVSYDAAAPERSSISVAVTAARIVADTAEARRRARLAGDGPGAEDVVEIQSRMLEQVLRVDEYPLVEFHSDKVESRGTNRLRVSGPMTLAGATRPVQADVWVRHIEGLMLFSARFEIRQTDFGIEPVSVGGVVKVADEIEIRFELWTRPAPGA